MARRGLLAELNRAAKEIAREQARAAQEAERERTASIRRAEQARRAEERALKQLDRAQAAERKRLEREAKEAHVAAMTAEVESLNLALEEAYADIDSLLEATLEVDDYVDLESLRVEAERPVFGRTDLETPIPPPSLIPDPPKPILIAPNPPTGLRRMLGRKSHERAREAAALRHERAVAEWEAELERLKARRRAAVDDHKRRESERLTELQMERERYNAEWEARKVEVAEQNAAVDELISGLAYGAVDAVQEYVSIVLSNSVYPEHFPVSHDFQFEPSSAELRLRVEVPPPEAIPDIKLYKYTKSADEITTTSLSQKAQKDRYASAVHQVALRTIHEVFEADRRGIIHTIDLEVGTRTIEPATGREAFLLFVAVASARESFLDFDLSSVVPSATLAHLGGAVSKNPFGLVTVDASGLRKS